MSSVISASTTSNTALNLSGDTSGQLEIKTGAGPTTAITISSAQLTTIANDATISGLTVGKGGGSIVGNTAVGFSALQGANTGTGQNTAVGYNSLYTNTSGAYNTAIGISSALSNTTGQLNFAGGYQALYFNTTGSYNTAIGGSALQFNTTASYNTAVGYQAGYSGTTTNSNAYFGAQAGYSDTTVGGNTGIGFQALQNAAGASYNTTLGYRSGYLITSGSKNTILGNYSGNQGGLDIRTSNNYIVLSDGDGNPRQVINNNGQVAFGTVSPYGSFIETIKGDGVTQGILAIQDSSTSYGTSDQYITFLNSTNGTAGSVQHTAATTVAYSTSSDERLKENIVDAPNALDKIGNIQVRSYVWKEDKVQVEYGFVAQELAKVYAEPVGVGGDDVKTNPWNVEYGRLTPILVKAIQEQQAQIEELKAEVQVLKGVK